MSNVRNTFLSTLVLSVSLLLTVGCSHNVNQSGLAAVSPNSIVNKRDVPENAVFLAPDILDLGNGAHEFVERGLLFVAENRNKPDSDKIAVHFMRLPSTSEKPATPIFMLAGGPGGSWFEDVKVITQGVDDSATGRHAYTLKALEDLRSASPISNRA